MTDKAFIRLISDNYNVVFVPINEYIPRMWQQDVQQDILLAAWQAYPAFRGDCKFSTWLYKIALYKCIQWRATERARLRRDEAYDPGEAIEQPLEWSAVLRSRLHKKPLYFDLLALKYAFGIKQHRIALMMNMNPSTIAVKIKRGKEYFLTGKISR